MPHTSRSRTWTSCSIHLDLETPGHVHDRRGGSWVSSRTRSCSRVLGRIRLLSVSIHPNAPPTHAFVAGLYPADVGFGGALLKPLPLTPGRLTDIPRSSRSFRWSLDGANRFTSTHPTSTVQNAFVQLTTTEPRYRPRTEAQCPARRTGDQSQDRRWPGDCPRPGRELRPALCAGAMHLVPGFSRLMARLACLFGIRFRSVMMEGSRDRVLRGSGVY